MRPSSFSRTALIPVAQGSKPASVFLPRSEFDTFLFAPIGEGSNGMTLSVLSMLARTGADPWQQAAELARLPGGAATAKLASLIAAQPDYADAHRDPATTAARVIALLPRHIAAGVAPLKSTLGSAKSQLGSAKSQTIVITLIFVAVLLGCGWMWANLEAPRHAVDQPPAPLSSNNARH